ncbi:ComEC/Rec2 family competence protein [Endomicrobium proavitum]|uniref:ComEC-like cytoplasmic membrane protein n=1 Tax=Endomicrobium proavitum TaxID=1408281 RepID=A0A0G3WIW3_9BACT|nr:ComEC/Rec2 family competence protein [Endomicrobium proavitum]AKL97434.1 ComEC-like cytoplasmic membrane protein [Endomicrobium proavitum]
MKLLLKRPAITVFIIYALTLITLDYCGFFAPEKQSLLLNLVNSKTDVNIEGKIISDPEPVKNGKRFIFQTSQVNGKTISEKILVNCPAAYNVSYGDVLALEGRLKIPLQAPLPLLFNYRTYLARENIYTTFDVKYFEFITSKPSFIKKYALLIQKDISNKFDAYFSKKCAEILKPIIVGDKSSLEKETRDNFIDAGLMHILVVSGLNVAYVSVIFLFLFKLLGFSLKKAYLLCIPFLFLYALITGAQPPVMRAVIMFSCMLISLALDREPLIYNSLALSALLILIAQPQQLFGASFQMSYIATIGIVYFYSKIMTLFQSVNNPILKFLCETFAVTLSAQILLIPICMYYFGKISLISFVSNIIIVPAIGIMLALGIIFYFLTFISRIPAEGLAYVISLITQAVIFLTEFFAQFKYAAINVAKPDIIKMTLYFLFAFSLFSFKDKKRFLFSGLILSAGFIYAKAAQPRDAVNVYKSPYITTTHTIKNGNHSFLIENKARYDNKYYAKSFEEFLRYSAIKKADIKAVGFSKETAEKIVNATKSL